MVFINLLLCSADHVCNKLCGIFIKFFFDYMNGGKLFALLRICPMNWSFKIIQYGGKRYVHIEIDAKEADYFLLLSQDGNSR